MQGSVTADREAVLLVTLVDASGAERAIRAVLDTGFTDYLTLPKVMIDFFGYPFLAADGGPLVGMSLLYGSYLEMDIASSPSPHYWGGGAIPVRARVRLDTQCLDARLPTCYNGA